MTSHVKLMELVELEKHYHGCDHDDLCDVLEAILNLHTDQGVEYTEPNGGATITDCEGCGDYWPCSTVDIVVDALRKTGVL